MRDVIAAFAIIFLALESSTTANSQQPDSRTVRSIPTEFRGEWGTSANDCRGANSRHISEKLIEIGPSGTDFLSGFVVGNELRMRGKADLDDPTGRTYREDIVMTLQGDRMQYTSTVQGRRPRKETLVRCGKNLTAAQQILRQPPTNLKKISYGSRAGMEVDVVSVQSLDTNQATINVSHTRENARGFCVEYLDDRSAQCIERTLREVKIASKATANCGTGAFTTLYGEQLLFKGKNPKASRGGRDISEPDFVILRWGEQLDGSSASGYSVAKDQYRALCPASFSGR